MVSSRSEKKNNGDTQRSKRVSNWKFKRFLATLNFCRSLTTKEDATVRMLLIAFTIGYNAGGEQEES